MLKILVNSVRWVFIWTLYVAVICLIGAVVGVITHVLFGLGFVESADLFYYASLGFFHGLKYGGVWAGGAALVLCVLRARREYLAAHGDPEAGEGV